VLAAAAPARACLEARRPSLALITVYRKSALLFQALFALCHMEMVLVGADQSKESTLVSGMAVHGSERPTTADSEDPPSWGTWATDGKYVVLPKTWSGASYF
jgi:hypothetical protein